MCVIIFLSLSHIYIYISIYIYIYIYIYICEIFFVRDSYIQGEIIIDRYVYMSANRELLQKYFREM